jgi:hypothetical protein
MKSCRFLGVIKVSTLLSIQQIERYAFHRAISWIFAALIGFKSDQKQRSLRIF